MHSVHVVYYTYTRVKVRGSGGGRKRPFFGMFRLLALSGGARGRPQRSCESTRLLAAQNRPKPTHRSTCAHAAAPKTALSAQTPIRPARAVGKALEAPSALRTCSAPPVSRTRLV